METRWNLITAKYKQFGKKQLQVRMMYLEKLHGENIDLEHAVQINEQKTEIQVVKDFDNVMCSYNILDQGQEFYFINDNVILLVCNKAFYVLSLSTEGIFLLKKFVYLECRVKADYDNLQTSIQTSVQTDSEEKMISVLKRPLEVTVLDYVNNLLYVMVKHNKKNNLVVFKITDDFNIEFDKYICTDSNMLVNDTKIYLNHPVKYFITKEGIIYIFQNIESYKKVSVDNTSALKIFKTELCVGPMSIFAMYNIKTGLKKEVMTSRLTNVSSKSYFIKTEDNKWVAETSERTLLSKIEITTLSFDGNLPPNYKTSHLLLQQKPSTKNQDFEISFIGPRSYLHKFCLLLYGNKIVKPVFNKVIINKGIPDLQKTYLQISILSKDLNEDNILLEEDILNKLFIDDKHTRQLNYEPRINIDEHYQESNKKIYPNS
jgi:hypothetical protein